MDRHKCLLEMPVLQLEANADTQTVVVEFINGSIVKYHSGYILFAAGCYKNDIVGVV